jgi:hypothetical protein
MKKLIIIMMIVNFSYPFFGVDGLLTGTATLIAKWGTGALDVMSNIAVGDIDGAGKKIDSLLNNDREIEQRKINLLESIGTTLELQKKENEGWFRFMGRKYDESKDVAIDTLRAINEYERTKQKWQEYSQRSGQWLESFLNGELPSEQYLSTFADLEDIYLSMTKAEKKQYKKE